jgi:hypothetical protein
VKVAVVVALADATLFETKTITNETIPCVAGFQEHVATKDPLVALFLHPGMYLPRS